MSQLKCNNKIDASLRNSVWVKYMGSDKGTGLCWCCGLETISRAQYHCSHVVARARFGAATLQNLRPCCQTCNLSMGTNSMKEYALARGYESAITKEPNPPEPQPEDLPMPQEAPMLPNPLPPPEEVPAGYARCEGCRKHFRPATLKYDGKCGGCFKKAYLTKYVLLKGTPDLLGKCPQCPWCANLCIVSTE